MSDYMADLRAALNASDSRSFATHWLAFGAAHYPDDGPVAAFLDVAALLRGQIDEASWWRLVLRFCEARLHIATSRTLMFEYAGLIAMLRDPLALREREILDATRQLRQIAEPSERWQFDHLLNSHAWQIRDREAVLERQRAFLTHGEIDSLYGVELAEIGSGSTVSAGPAEPPWSFGPGTLPDLWRVCAWETARDEAGLHLTGPFGYDTNHTGGAGLFALLAACDFRRMEGPAPRLEGATLRLQLSTGLTRPARLLLGVSAQERDPETGAPSGRSAYRFLDAPIPDGETDIDLRAADPRWRDMGGNPFSPPHLQYCVLPAAEMLVSPMGLYLMLMQDSDRMPKEGRVTLGSMSLNWPT